MDYLTHCYVSYFCPYPDRPDIRVRGRWHWCPPGAKVIPYTTPWGSSYLDGNTSPCRDLLGEQYSGRSIRAGRVLPGYDGQHWCGSPEVWARGMRYADRRPALPVDPDGVLRCCRPGVTPESIGGMELGGVCAVYSGVPEVAEIGLALGWPSVEIPPASLGLAVGPLVAGGGIAGVDGPLGLEIGPAIGSIDVGGAVAPLGLALDLGGDLVVAEIGISIGPDLHTGPAPLGLALGLEAQPADVSGAVASLGLAVGPVIVGGAIDGGSAPLGLSLGVEAHDPVVVDVAATLGLALGLGAVADTIGGAVAPLGLALGVEGVPEVTPDAELGLALGVEGPMAVEPGDSCGFAPTIPWDARVSGSVPIATGEAWYYLGPLPYTDTYHLEWVGGPDITYAVVLGGTSCADLYYELVGETPGPGCAGGVIVVGVLQPYCWIVMTASGPDADFVFSLAHGPCP